MAPIEGGITFCKAHGCSFAPRALARLSLLTSSVRVRPLTEGAANQRVQGRFAHEDSVAAGHRPASTIQRPFLVEARGPYVQELTSPFANNAPHKTDILYA